MKRASRWVLGVVGVVSLMFGLGCINYTKADGLDHHREVARRHGLPPPSQAILFGGVGAISMGAGLLGFLLGASKRPEA